jgi:HPt (histidine-containing phosphotransfer) domain-containing protein
MSDTSQNQDLDLSFLYEIAGGNNEFIVESIGMFLQQTPELLQAIDQSIGVQDWKTVASSAHKLKSNLGFFGMLASQALIQDVEIFAKNGGQEPGQLTAKFKQVKEIVDHNLITLNKIKAEKEAAL